MALINTASKLYIGSTPALAAYKNGFQIWPPGTGNQLSVTLTHVSGATVRAQAGAVGVIPSSYSWYTSVNGGAWSFWKSTTASGPHDFTTSYSSTIRMKVEALYPDYSPMLTALSNTVSIGAAPPPPTEQRYVELEAYASASYTGSGSNRGTNELYYGYYSSIQGQQKCLWNWNIPSDVRHCIHIDRIDVRVYNIHAYLNSGGSTGLVVHHGSNIGGNFPGSTGILQHYGSNWMIGTPKPGYMSQGGSDWMTSIHVLNAPGRPTLAEEFRVNGAVGMGLASPSSSTNHYGYAAGAYHPSGQKPAIRIWYTVYK